MYFLIDRGQKRASTDFDAINIPIKDKQVTANCGKANINNTLLGSNLWTFIITNILFCIFITSLYKAQKTIIIIVQNVSIINCDNTNN